MRSSLCARPQDDRESGALKGLLSRYGEDDHDECALLVVLRSPMSAAGQNRKSSRRAHVFRFAPDSGHCATLLACAKICQPHTSAKERVAFWYETMGPLMSTHATHNSAF